MKAILVDDELPLLNELKTILSRHKDVEIVGTYTDPTKALIEAEETKPDFALLDIEMTNLNGIMLAEKLLEQNPRMDILFITAYNHYATEAFDVNATDYILKPVHSERLKKAMDKISQKRNILAQMPEAVMKIQSFGSFAVYIGGEPLKWTRSKQKELFAYLLQHEGQWIGKYKICDDLWRDSVPEQALANLQTTMWAIRKSLKEIGRSQIRIEYSNDSYFFHLKDIQWDLKQFEEGYKACINGKENENWSEVVSIYRGEYLDGEDWLWAVIERERYARKFAELKKHKGKIKK